MNDHVFETIIEMAKTDTWDVRKEAAWVIKNALKTASNDDTIRMINRGLLSAIKLNLHESENATKLIYLYSVENLLKRGDKSDSVNPYLTLLESEGIISKVENLQQHELDEIY